MRYRFFFLFLLAAVLASCSKHEVKYRIGVSQCSADIWRDKQNAELKMGAYFQEGVELKFAAAYDTTPPSAVRLTLCGKPKKVVTRVKGIWVTAYHARLGLSAHPQVTAFLYETGIGSKNSQGFGMIELINWGSNK